MIQMENGVNHGGRFNYFQLQQAGSDEIFAGYISYWVFYAINLGDLLNSSPDMPQIKKTGILFESN
jgi:hypothetical protein